MALTRATDKIIANADGNLNLSGIVTASRFSGPLVPSGDVNVGSNIKIGAASGIVTATSFSGDGSNLTSLPAGLGTALSSTQTSPLNKLYYTNEILSIGATVTVDHPATGTGAYTQYADIRLEEGADLIIEDGDDVIPDILGLGTDGGGLGAGGSGRIRVDSITNKNANGAPNFTNGVTGTAATFTNSSTIAGIVTLTSGGVDTIGVVTATSFVGSGANLTGIDATKIITGNTQVQTIDTGSDGHVKVTTEGSERLRITSTGKVLVNTTTASSVGNSTYSMFEVSGNTSGATGPGHLSLKRGTASASLSDGDTLSRLIFSSLDGGDFAYIQASVDGSPSGSDFPASLRFHTCADGASSSTERLRIGSAGQLGIGGATYGTAGQVLTSGGASAAPTWGGAGKVLQMTYKRGGVTSSSNSGGWTDSVESGLNVDITPLSATSRIIIQMHSVGGNTSSGRSYFLRLRRKVNNTGDTNVASFQIGDGSNGGMQSLALTHVDYDASSPFNTSHVRNYRIRFGQDGSGTARFDYATTSVLYCLEIQ